MTAGARGRFLEARLTREGVREAYGRVAPIYDLWSWIAESGARRRMLELAAVTNGMSVLEVAVGTGETFSRILRRNPDGRNAGIDLTPAMLERARRKARRVARGNYQLATGDGVE